MNRYVLILGRQPNLSIAELESLYGPDSLVSNESADLAILSTENPELKRLGGTIKAGVIHEDTLPSFTQTKQYCQKLVNELAGEIEGKIKLGVSCYIPGTTTNQSLQIAMSCKSALKKAGRSVRVVPNSEPALNSAQSLNNKLTKGGIELIIFRHKKSFGVARSVYEQDIDDYARRDHGRPARDSYVGMLPPKLAQMIINISNPPVNGVILDPFCGTGVIAQEALLMGYPYFVATDIDKRMVDYTRKNIRWLIDNTPGFEPGGAEIWTIEQGDATTHKWKKIPDVVATETYLGQQYTHEPSLEELKKNINESAILHEKFLKHVHEHFSGTVRRLTIAVPVWFVGNKKYSLPTLENIGELGYNWLQFAHVDTETLIYRRPGQIVGRQLVTLSMIRK